MPRRRRVIEPEVDAGPLDAGDHPPGWGSWPDAQGDGRPGPPVSHRGRPWQGVDDDGGDEITGPKRCPVCNRQMVILSRTNDQYGRVVTASGCTLSGLSSHAGQRVLVTREG
jgi:hypothetical protein